MGSMGMPPMPGTSPMMGGTPSTPSPEQSAPPMQDSGAMGVINDVNNILRSARSISDQFPATQPIVDQINALVQQLQMKIVQAIPPQPQQVPPV